MADFHFQRIERQGELPLWRLQSDDPSIYIDVIANNRAGFVEFVLAWNGRRISFTAIQAIEGNPPSKTRNVFWTIRNIGGIGRNVEPYVFHNKAELLQALDHIRSGLSNYSSLQAISDLGLEVIVRSVTVAPILERYVQSYKATSGGEQ